MSILHSSANDAWMTPIPILEAAREVLGKITLDPASSPEANERVKAHMYFTKENDGLVRNWRAVYEMTGSVWCNPPGGRGVAKAFWTKLNHERQMGNIRHAIFLFFSIEGLQNCQGRVSPSMLPTCIPRKRIRFDHMPGLVDRTSLFIETFKQFGATR